MKVMKFGGTSVQDAEALRRLQAIVASRPGPRLVVVSALSKITDQLLQICKLIETQKSEPVLTLLEQAVARHLQVAKDLELGNEFAQQLLESSERLANLLKALSEIGEVSPRSRDLVVSHGELWSSWLTFGILKSKFPKTKWVDSRKIIRTDSEFGQAAVQWPETRQQAEKFLQPILIENEIAVAQGFIGSDGTGSVTTLGRGGSDYSGAIFGSCLQAQDIEIWTDVPGIMTTDPRLVPQARTIAEMHYSEAAEMAYFGAKVLHPATIFPAVESHIPVVILNSKEPQASGTRISHQTSKNPGIQGIAFKQNATLINIHSTRMLGSHGFLKTVFDLFAEHRISVDLISTSEVSLSLTLDPSHDPKELVPLLEKLKQFATVEKSENLATVSLVGQGIRSTAGLGARIFEEIKDFNVRMISMGASELNLSLVVDQKDLPMIAQKLHRLIL